MKLTIKLVSILVFEIVLLLMIDGYLSVRREIRQFDSEMEHKALMVGHAMKDLVADVWQKSGQQRAMQLIKDANRGDRIVNIRWVWLNASPENYYGPRLSPSRLERVAHGIEMSFRGEDRNGTEYRYTYVPVLTGGDRPGAIEVSESLTYLNRYARTTAVRGLILIGLLIVASGCLALLAGVVMVGGPLDRIMEKVRRIGTGDLSGPIELRERHELSELAQSLNTMCERLAESQDKIYKETTARIRTLEQLRHADRLRTVGRLASGVAHELGTPLNVVSGRAGLIASGTLTEDEVLENANIIKAQTDRMTAIIRQLLDFARRRPPRKAPVDLRNIASQTLNLLAPLGKQQAVTLELSDKDAPIIGLVDAAQIQQVLTNLIINAIHAMPHGGTVKVHIRKEQPGSLTGLEGKYLCMDVCDEGVGISAENLDKLFEPFFSTKEAGEGTGLGLSISYGIVQDHGGRIDVKSEPGKGSCFSVYLPQEVNG